MYSCILDPDGHSDFRYIKIGGSKNNPSMKRTLASLFKTHQPIFECFFLRSFSFFHPPFNWAIIKNFVCQTNFENLQKMGLYYQVAWNTGSNTFINKWAGIDLFKRDYRTLFYLRNRLKQQCTIIYMSSKSNAPI